MKSGLKHTLLSYTFLHFFFIPISYADDSATMLILRASLSPSPSPSWIASDSFCTWSGVVCDASSRVTSINLSSKSLSGILPSDLTSLSHLTSLSLQRNNLNGPIPFLANTLLKNISLDSNAFSSVPIDAFGNLPSLETLTLNNNPSLSPWEFPDLSNSTNLTVFEAVNTTMTGPFTTLFWYPNLKVLRLSYNQLTGTIEQDPGYPLKLETLWIDHQEMGLTGPIDSLSMMTQLSQVWLNNNAFSGPIPDLSNCTNIFDLQLGNNHLLGVIPKSLSSLPNLMNISLQSNNLYGPFPNFPARVKVEVGNVSEFCSEKPGVPCGQQVSALLSVMESLGNPTILLEAWGGSDACKWEFIGCDNNGNVTSVNLSGQQFGGEIPVSLSSLTTLQVLFLNDNAFVGGVPESFAELHQLKLLDVSRNFLTGKMPKFQSSVRVNVDGNVLAANESVFEAANASTEDFHNPGTASTNSRSILGMNVKAFIAVFVVLSTLVVLGICTVLCLVSKRRRENEWEEDTEEQFSDGNSSQCQVLGGLLRRFSYDRLKTITGNFDPAKKLGSGGFGSVYEGTLRNGTKVAVKRLDRLGQGRKEFVAEVKTLGTIHHVNLVKLIGFCEESAYKLLVYEYLSNGSLDKWIFRNQEFKTLSWNTRKKIVIQIAKGLAYLHEECEQRIAHLDIKPQNILLDENLNVKVADFGLAKLIDRNESFVMTQMRGTRGYLAPEWLSRKITEKADVYSFGIVLLEVVYGRRNLEYSMHHKEDDEEGSGYDLLIYLVKKKAEANRLSDLADGGMDGNGEEVERMVKIGIWCLHEDPTRRPKMSIVVKALEGEMDVMGVELEYGYTSTNVTDWLGGSSEQGHSSLVSASVLSGPR